MRYISPFNLQQYLKTPSLRFDWIPFVDILLIFLCMSALSSQYILPLGMEVNLPGKSIKDLSGVQTQDVVTVLSNDMILYAGFSYSLITFSQKAKDDLDFNGKKVLLRSDRAVDAQMLMDLCGVFKEAGCRSVQIAVKSKQESLGINY